ncbi:MAG: hypothetical protein ACK4TF_03975 [Thermodesulfovibrionales bacterium]
MKNCLSIEGKTVKIVEAIKRPHGTFIQKTLTIPLDNLDSYLATTKQKDFILSVDFKELLQDFLYLPPVRGANIVRLLQHEVNRLYPGFYYIYSDLGEKIIENKRSRLLSILRAHKSEVDELINKFLMYGKNIKAIYAAPSCIASFINRSEKPILCIFETDEKNIFLIRNGIILFTRKLTTFQKGLSQLDIQGIEMSITHCIQNLRIPPEEIVLAGDFKELPSSIGGLKVTPLKLPEGLHYKGTDVLDYLLPIGCLYLSSKESFLPEEYRRFRLLRGILTANAVIFGVFFVISLMVGINNIITIQSIKTDISDLPTKYRVFTSFVQSYNNTVQEAKALSPLRDLVEKEKRPQVSGVLKEVSGYSLNNIEIKSIDLSTSGDSISMRLSGRANSSSHKEMLISFNRLLDSIKAGSEDSLMQTEITNKKFSGSDGSFDIDLRFRSSE